MSVACVDGGRVDGCWSCGVEGTLMRRCVASATGSKRREDSGERRIVAVVGEMWCWTA